MQIAGLDIGGTKCAVLMGQIQEDGELRMIRKEIFTTEAAGQSLETIYGILDPWMSTYHPEAIGISCGGPLNSRTGVILNPPNLYGWENVPIVEELQARYGVPARLENDANACAVAEWKFGAAKGAENVIFLTCGTGLGAGIIINGHLISGTSGMAGEVGHIRLSNYGPAGYGKVGSFEGFCSGGGIAQLGRLRYLEGLQQGRKSQRVQDIKDLDSLTAKSIAQAARAGDETARAVLEESAAWMGRGLAILVDLLNPQILVLGSVYARCCDMMFPGIMRELAKEALPQSLADCSIVPAGLGDEIGDYAALSLAIL